MARIIRNLHLGIACQNDIVSICVWISKHSHFLQEEEVISISVEAFLKQPRGNSRDMICLIIMGMK